MKISMDDNPRHQFLGPICAGLIILKYRELLDLKLNLEQYFVDDDRVISGLIDLLFDQQLSSLQQKIIGTLQNISMNAVLIIKDAFVISSNLKPIEKIRSFEFINRMLQSDLNLLKILIYQLDDLAESYELEVISWYMRAANRERLRQIKPIADTCPMHLINHLGIYDAKSFYQYCNDYYLIPYNLTYSQYPHRYKEIKNYAPTYSCDHNFFSYAEVIEPEVKEKTVKLHEYLTQALENTTGVLGWRYKTGHCLSVEQLERIIKHAKQEINFPDEVLETSAWETFDTGTSRSLAMQLKCSLSEISKSDKTIIPKMTR